MKKWIYNFTLGELKAQLSDYGKKSYLAEQVFRWLYTQRVNEISEWTNVSQQDRGFLRDHFSTDLNKIEDTVQNEQGVTKILMRLMDGNRIESVLIPEGDHFTLCVSSQAGCNLGCKFCATGALGFSRNLSMGEILAQILLLRRFISRDYHGKLNIVFMGMGEPLLNPAAVENALSVVTAPKGLAISPRRITLSTVGILEPLEKFEATFPLVKIALSLNAACQEERARIMPVSRTETLPQVLTYLRERKRRHRITFGYVMLSGVNDTPGDARRLIKLVRGIPCKINLIPFNQVAGLPFSEPPEQVVAEFADILRQAGLTVMIRWSKGKDIQSACGQLALQGSR